MRLSRHELRALAGAALTDREIATCQEPTWLRWPLVATAEARAKLAAWCVATPRPWAAPTEERVLIDLHCYGDETIWQIAAHVIAQLPPPVAAYTIRTVTLLGVGLSVRGWCGPRPHLDDARPHFVVIGADPARGRDRVEGLIAHELAHAWLLPAPHAQTWAGRALWMNTIHTHPIDDLPEAHRAMVASDRAAYAKHEQITERLVEAWGFKTP